MRKRQTRLAGLDGRVLDLYAGGLSVRDIAAHLIELERFDGRARELGAHHPVPGAARQLRRAVYTTNTIEALHRQIRKAIKTRGHFPDEQAATKPISATPATDPLAGIARGRSSAQPRSRPSLASPATSRIDGYRRRRAPAHRTSARAPAPAPRRRD